MTGLLHISAQTLNACRKLRSFRKWDEAMDINPQDKTSYTTQYQEPFLNNVENDYSAKHRWMSVIKPVNLPSSNFFLSA